jgi:hypothetical protein
MNGRSYLGLTLGALVGVFSGCSSFQNPSTTSDLSFDSRDEPLREEPFQIIMGPKGREESFYFLDFHGVGEGHNGNTWDVVVKIDKYLTFKTLEDVLQNNDFKMWVHPDFESKMGSVDLERFVAPNNGDNWIYTLLTPKQINAPFAEYWGHYD